jgi:HoxN/HupN/NixA family high-affinity nickel-transporter
MTANIRVLFGLGFDTASEVALLALAGTSAAANLPWYAVLTLPVLFAAGMSMMDTADGLFTTVAYDWAFAHPARKIFYNLDHHRLIGRGRAGHRHHRTGQRAARQPGLDQPGF